MEYIKQLNAIKKKIVTDTNDVYNNEMNNIINLLKVNDLSQEGAHYKNEFISLYEYKLDILKILEIFIDCDLPIENKTLINLVADLLIKKIPEISADFYMQLQDLFKDIWSKCLKILFYCGDINELPQISEFISTQEIPDIRNISICLIFKLEKFKSYDLESISKFNSFSVIYDVVKIYKDDILKELKAKILLNLFEKLKAADLVEDPVKKAKTKKEVNLVEQNEEIEEDIHYKKINEENELNTIFLEKIKKCKNLYFEKIDSRLNTRDLNFIYLIFSEINFLLFNSLIVKPVNGTFTNDYLKFIYSLILDVESAELVYKMFHANDVLSDLLSGVNFLVINYQTKKDVVNPADEKYLFFLLEVVIRILKYGWIKRTIKMTFMLFCDTLMKYVIEDAPKEAKGVVYEFLNLYLRDREMALTIKEFFRTKQIFTKSKLIQEFDLELKERKFFMMKRLLKFLFHINEELSIEIAIYCLRSEDPKTIKNCFKLFNEIKYDIKSNIMLNVSYIKRAMLKSTELVKLITEYQISKKTVFPDLLFVNTIMSVKNENFFKYASLFDEFGKFMNDNFLDRLIDNIPEGLEFLYNKMTNNIVRFIKKNVTWFNLFLKHNESYYSEILKVYQKMLDFDRSIEMSFTEGFILLEKPNAILFDILSLKIISNKGKLENKGVSFEKGSSISKYITNKHYRMNQEELLSYCFYLKTRIFLGDNVEGLIKYLISDYKDIHDILGYHKLVTGINLDKGNKSVLCTYDVKDTKQFINLYPSSTDYEKIFAYFKIEDNSEIKKHEPVLIDIIKEEIIRLNMIANKSLEDKILYRQCLVTLTRLSNIDSIVRLIEDYEDKDLLLRVNIRNIMTNGTYFNNNCIMKGKRKLQIAAVYTLYFNGIWPVSMLRDWISALYKECGNDDYLQYLVHDINKKHDIEIY